MRIAVLGTGRIGGTLGRRWAAAGHDVTFGSRDPARPEAQQLAGNSGARVATPPEAVAGADVVALAVPFGAVRDVLASVGDLRGKVVIDCTNGRPESGEAASGGAYIAGLAPGAKVVKAFNGLGSAPLSALDPHAGGQRPVAFIAGDDAGAKAQVRELGEQLGFEVADLGGLANAALVEAAAMLWITLAYRQGRGPSFGLGLVPLDTG